MVRNDRSTYTASSVPQVIGPAADEDGTTVRGAVRAMVVGTVVTYVVCSLAIGLSVSLGLAALVAIWPAVFVGPMLGGLVALSRGLCHRPLAGVVSLARPEPAALGAAA
jgi:hypothetical protein